MSPKFIFLPSSSPWPLPLVHSCTAACLVLLSPTGHPAASLPCRLLVPQVAAELPPSVPALSVLSSHRPYTRETSSPSPSSSVSLAQLFSIASITVKTELPVHRGRHPLAFFTTGSLAPVAQCGTEWVLNSQVLSEQLKTIPLSTGHSAVGHTQVPSLSTGPAQ